MLLTLFTALAIAGSPVDAMQSVVVLFQGSTHCAGALIDDTGTVVTAYHCVAPGGRPAVHTISGEVFTGRVLAVDRANDLAVLAVEALALRPYIPLATEDPTVGQTVHALGHPFGVNPPAGYFAGTLRWSASEGTVGAVGERTIQFSAPIHPGNSGGPVVNSDGELVAVVSRKLGSSGLGFGAPARTVQELMDGSPGFSPLGGSVGLYPVATVASAPGGLLSIGARIELDLRDRLVVGGTLRTAVSPRWTALQTSVVQWAGTEVRGGLRQRIGRGRFAPRVDAYGGLVVFPALSTDELDDDFALTLARPTSPVAGAQIRVGGGGIDVSYAFTMQATLVSMVVNWPGNVRTW